LNDIDVQTPRQRRKANKRLARQVAKQAKKPKRVLRRIIIWFLVLAILAGLGVAGYTGYKLLSAGGAVFQGNIFEILRVEPLKKDSNGRSNFLILGTSEDNPGHEGANLTDSMMILSLSQSQKDVFMFSIPRDLYVEYKMACPAGYMGKINSYFMCTNDGDTEADEQDRLTKTSDFIGEIFGIDIQYAVRVNHTVIKEAVDAVGGVDVDIQGSDGAPGVLDRNFDWRCNYKCYLVKYDNGVHHLDGEKALFLSMARGSIAPTYGLGSNFDREQNQQKIIIALKEKAMTTGILTNLAAITQMIDALGNNLRTNIQTNEIRTLMQLASEIKTEDVYMLSLVDESSPVVKTGNYREQSVVMPSKGMFDYSEIRSYLAKKLSNDPIASEGAPVIVLNGSSRIGAAQTLADELESLGFNVIEVDNANSKDYEKTTIYQIGSGNLKTAAKLAEKFSTTIDANQPAFYVSIDSGFVIVVGAE
jgi:polyisoprenyl-teichoic acid--peptidoglycan teichoic acid transferase